MTEAQKFEAARIRLLMLESDDGHLINLARELTAEQIIRLKEIVTGIAH